MTRDELIDATVRDIMIRARLAELRELANETTRTYRALVQHGAPVEAIHAYFGCLLLRERLREQDERSKA
jgi:hypothetical protein